MKIELQQQLFGRYPLVLRTTSRTAPLAAWGIECGDGWFQILEVLLGQFEAYAQARLASGIARSQLPYAAQVKEKMGTLRVYIRMRERVSELDLALDQAEAASYSTCESCGAPGVGRNEGGWLRVSCDACEARPRDDYVPNAHDDYMRELKKLLAARGK